MLQWRDHCTNAGGKNFSHELPATEEQPDMPARIIRLFKVMDSCCTTKCPVTATIEERLKELRSVTAKDGIHYIDEGYKNLAHRCTESMHGSSRQKRAPGMMSRDYGGSSRGVVRGRSSVARGRARGARGHKQYSRSLSFHAPLQKMVACVIWSLYDQHCHSIRLPEILCNV